MRRRPPWSWQRRTKIRRRYHWAKSNFDRLNKFYGDNQAQLERGAAAGA